MQTIHSCMLNLYMTAQMSHNLVEAHCYGIGRTGQIFEQSRSSEETDRNVDVSTAKVFVSTMLKKVESDWPNIYSNLVTL